MQLFDLEAEMAVLGAMMLGDRGAVSRAADLLKPADFYRDHHQTLFAAMLALDQSGTPVEIVTLKDELNRRGQLDRIGGLVYLLELGNLEFTTGNLEHYAKIVEGHAIRRRLKDAAKNIARMVNEADIAPSDLKDAAERQILTVQTSSAARPYRTTAEIVSRVYAKIGENYERAQSREDAPLTGVDTGLPELNAMTSGLQKSDLILLAARPSMGKSSCAFQVGYHAARPTAVKDDQQVSALFSLEMNEESVVFRQLCAMAEVDSHRARKGWLSDAEWDRLGNASALLYEYRACLVDDVSLTPNGIRSHCRRIRAEQGRLDLVVVDYVGLIQTEGQRGWNRNDELTYIIRALKSLARELDTPVLVLSQLSRSLERREDKRPMLSDLRDSGSLEAEADVTMFIYRPAYYERKKRQEGEGKPEGDASGQRALFPVAEEAEIIIAKQRNGPTGTILLDFVPSLTTFAPVGTYRRMEG